MYHNIQINSFNPETKDKHNEIYPADHLQIIQYHLRKF